MNKWPTLCCSCLGSPAGADFWLCSRCCLSRFFYGLILWVPGLLVQTPRTSSHLMTQSEEMPLPSGEMCWTVAGVLALGLAPHSSETVEDLSLGSWWSGCGPGEFCVPYWASSSSFTALASWLLSSGWETHTPTQWKSSRQVEGTCLAWLGALHPKSDAGWAATPSERHTWC